MLIGNYSVLSKSPGRFSAGTSLSCDRGAFNKSGANRNKYQVFSNFNGIPIGYTPPYSFVIAQKDGGLASLRQMISDLNLSNGLLNSGKNIEASLDGSISVTEATVGLIVSLEAMIVASGEFTDAQLAAVSELVAALTAGIAVTNAQIGAIVDMITSMNASFTLTNADNFSTAAMDADLSVQNEFSASNLANAVWNAVAGDYNEANSMGEKLNDAGSAANPWTEIIEGSFTATEVLRLLLAVAAGKTDIVDNGDGTAVVKFRDTGDSKDRITANMTGSERTSITRDVT